MNRMKLGRGGSSPRLLAFAGAALIILAGVISAAAQTTNPPATNAPAASAPAPVCAAQPAMTFTGWTSNVGQSFGEGSREYIFADGFFCTDTDQQFQTFLNQNPSKAVNTIVVLNSGGGDLGAGLRMGTIIRKSQMWTQVGSQLPLMIPQNENIPAQSADDRYA